ncbi:MAG: hypothetical protein HKN17_07145 [Rhodothermales bacterium]|nr:hypothetical protein [Rhodothermales bacterium]
MNTHRPVMLRGAERLRDLYLRLAWRVASIANRAAEPDEDDFGQFLKRAGGIADPGRDNDMMAYWLVTRATKGHPVPESLGSAWNRFSGRRRRDPERARAWRALILRWAELQESDEPHGRIQEFGESPSTLHEAILGEAFETVPPGSASLAAAALCEAALYEGAQRSEVMRPRRAPRASALSATRSVAAVATAAVLAFAVWLVPARGPAFEASHPSASSLGIEQLERGSRSLVEQTLRARYIETLHQVQRVRITAIGEEMEFERILLEGARLDVERAIGRHRETGRVPPALYLLLGKLSLMTKFEAEGRRALARAANYGGATGAEARELLALLPD